MLAETVYYGVIDLNFDYIIIIMYIIYNSLNHTLSPCRVHIENVWSKVRESGKFMRCLYCWILNLRKCVQILVPAIAHGGCLRWELTV